MWWNNNKMKPNMALCNWNFTHLRCSSMVSNVSFDYPWYMHPINFSFWLSTFYKIKLMGHILILLKSYLLKFDFNILIFFVPLFMVEREIYTVHQTKYKNKALKKFRGFLVFGISGKNIYKILTAIKLSSIGCVV